MGTQQNTAPDNRCPEKSTPFAPIANNTRK